MNVGVIRATAANSRAFYPVLQLSLAANGGKTFGRAPQGLTEKSSEKHVDAYLSNPRFYAVGMFDDSPDGNGHPMHITPFFMQDLAAPFGSEDTPGFFFDDKMAVVNASIRGTFAASRCRFCSTSRASPCSCTTTR